MSITIPNEYGWCILAVGGACFAHLYGSFRVRGPIGDMIAAHVSTTRPT